PRIEQALQKALATSLPSLELLPDAQDRFYAALAWRYAPQKWWKGYLAELAVDDRATERLRLESLEGLIRLSPHLTAALKELQKPALQVGSPANVGRRMNRLLTGLRKAFAKTPIAAGDQVGAALESLIRDAFRPSGAPSPAKTVCGIAEEVARLIHEIVRSEFSLAINAMTYQPIGVVRSW